MKTKILTQIQILKQDFDDLGVLIDRAIFDENADRARELTFERAQIQGKITAYHEVLVMLEKEKK
jgi:hypothetical protein